MKRFALRLMSFVLALMLLTGSAALADAGSTYLYAQELLAQSRFADAAEKFAVLGSYEDAALLAMYCRACAMCEAGDYTDGIAVLKAMGDYKDCPYRATYYEARQLEAAAGTDDWLGMADAAEAFLSPTIHFFLDSQERFVALSHRFSAAQKAQYDAAIAAGEAGDYDTCHESLLLLALAGYSDSSQHLTYYYIRADEADLTKASTGHDVQRIADRYTEMGDFLDCATRAAALTAQATAILDGQYDAAVALMNEGKYDEAITAFTALNGHKDSAAQIAVCETGILDDQYDTAVALMNAGKYDEAITAFTALNGYRNSAAQIAACETGILDDKYNAAVALMNAGKYDEAITAFTALDGYKDSAAQIAACKTGILDDKYTAAVALMNEGKYDEAYTAFAALNGHKDSAEIMRSLSDRYLVSPYLTVSMGDSFMLGFYEQDKNTSNGKEPIEWFVLAVEPDRILVISRYALDSRPYHNSKGNVTWEKSSLRSWLNNEFLHNAFTQEEQKQILTASVPAAKNSKKNIDGGPATNDKIFLLSAKEAERYYAGNKAMQCQPTAYAQSRGAKANAAGYVRWLLRTPGDSQKKVGYINYGGRIIQAGADVNAKEYAVRPAMWLTLTP